MKKIKEMFVNLNNIKFNQFIIIGMNISLLLIGVKLLATALIVANDSSWFRSVNWSQVWSLCAISLTLIIAVLLKNNLLRLTQIVLIFLVGTLIVVTRNSDWVWLTIECIIYLSFIECKLYYIRQK